MVYVLDVNDYINNLGFKDKNYIFKDKIVDKSCIK